MGAIVQAKQGAAAPIAEEGQEQQYLTFALAGEMFAVPIRNIKEIIEYGQLTSVPMMPSFILGVINLRGSVVPVVDMSLRFGRQPTGITRRTCIVIIEVDTAGERQDIGMMVDSVSEVLEIPRSEIEPPSFLRRQDTSGFHPGHGQDRG